jgi:hypothetical protein
VDREAVRKAQCRSRPQGGPDLGLENLCLDVVGHQEHDDIRFRYRFGYAFNDKAVFFRNRFRPAPCVQPDHNRNPAFPQVLGVCVSLAAISQDGHFPVLQDFRTCVAFVKDLCHFQISPFDSECGIP